MTGRTRLDTLLADLRAVYPGAETPTDAQLGHPDVRSFRILLSRRFPRLLVPLDCPPATAAAVGRDSAQDRVRDAVGRRAVATIAVGPLSRHVFRDVVSIGPVDTTSVEAHLAAQIGEAVRLSVHGGSERANAKPVLGVHRVTGAEVGFCKVGITPLASQLVRDETAALRLLDRARLGSIGVPPVLYAGQWQGHPVMLTETLSGHRGRGRVLPVEAMRDVAAVTGTATCPLRSSPWAAAVRARSVRAAPALTARIQAALDGLLHRDGDQLLAHGAGHGDWGPWNMSWRRDRPLVWDWERFTSDVPVGMDAAHYTAHEQLREIGAMDRGLATLRRAGEPAVRTVLAPWSAALGADTSRTVVDAYLLDLACRLAVDANEASAVPAGRLAAWYLDVAAERLQVTTALAPTTERAGGWS